MNLQSICLVLQIRQRMGLRNQNAAKKSRSRMLFDRLMENEKNEVIVVDNYFTGSKDNLKKWIGHPRFELIRHDVTETLLVEVDRIYHLACPVKAVLK
ncbi:UDP-glucuronic acid decarboxylase 5-like isoform X1 [Rosa rugosa]|uniref:UDP-glucuronic acid decarboxylase 5-like isoform X1 n=1 Tax=Rosa rugosa TaxID=74645 RepID=UPI002B4135E2|nr:UDP-glucuronic acid decarboxylase 5-like isoform X1 [Rosa rugosa]XP_061992650.1 UDP-glucuronic acid decarboxylase 5-like isoform X1 [Rosa rugosa]XP_061992651.1 UDP-glucuronic acid decarboxylase 5-like isoform X1 [Rosa rugosa]